MLDDVTPPAAPTATVKRKGKAIRHRRQLGVAAGVGVAIVAAALLPGLLRGSKPSGPITPQHKNPKVTVGVVRSSGPSGLIARGAIDGKPWRITLGRQGKDTCVRTSGDLPQNGCGLASDDLAGWPVTLEGAGGGRTEALYGRVAGQVKRVSVELSDGVVLNLRPVTFSGHPWIGVELPAKLAVTRVVAYSRKGELAYAIPFSVRGGVPSVQAWLRPGQRVPREFVRLIGSGVSAGKQWSITVHEGPWGECVAGTVPGGGSGVLGCWSDSSRQPGLIIGSGGLGQPQSWFIGVARPQVSYLVMAMTDGSTRHVGVVRVGKLPLYAVVMPNGPRIASWAAYDASGHRLYGGRGAPTFDDGHAF